jgi:hypothetical protein
MRSKGGNEERLWSRYLHSARRKRISNLFFVSATEAKYPAVGQGSHAEPPYGGHSWSQLGVDGGGAPEQRLNWIQQSSI